MIALPECFETGRLRAERLRPEHHDEIHRMHQDPAQMASLGGVRTLEQTAQYMDRNLRHWEEYGFGVWLLRDHGGAVAGRALLRHLWIAEVDEIEVGYSLHPEYWGRRLAPEIAQTLVDMGHRRFGQSIVALTLPTNIRSQRVMMRVGLTYEREVQHEGELHVLFRSTVPAPRSEEA